MKIAVVDDNIDDLNLIYNVLKSLDMFNTIDLYTNGNDILSHNNKYNYICLDIEMPNVDGIALSKKLASIHTKIIFITHHSQRMIEAFGMNIVKYILKDNVKDELIRFFNHEKTNNKSITLTTYKTNISVLLNDIIFIEYIDNDLFFYLSNNEIIKIMNKSLKEYEFLLDNHFYKINRKTIINILHIQNFNKNVIEIFGYEKLVSRRNIQDLKVKLLERKIGYV